MIGPVLSFELLRTSRRGWHHYLLWIYAGWLAFLLGVVLLLEIAQPLPHNPYGRMPRRRDVATIVAEFVSPGKRNRKRDYEEKRDEYMAMRVGEYWVIDRFDRTMTVFTRSGEKIKARVIREHQTYKTPLLPGFEPPLAELLAVADACPTDLDDD